MQGNRPTPGEVHCLVERGTDSAMLVRLEGALANQRRPIRVLVERRADTRRELADRRVAAIATDRLCRRRIRNATGRRVADRRSAARTWTEGALLGRRLARTYGELRLVEQLPTAEPDLAETLRLVVRFQSGDTTAFREIYERFFTSIYRFLRSALADEHAAEDQCQEVFVRAFRGLPAYEIRGVPFEAWLFRIARNQAIDERKRRESVVVEDPARLGRRQQVLERGPVRGQLDFDDGHLIALVQRLPLAQRQVLVLRYLVDLDWKTIALALDKSPGAVRQLEQRAFATLRHRLEAPGPAPNVKRLSSIRLQVTSPVTTTRRNALAV